MKTQARCLRSILIFISIMSFVSHNDSFGQIKFERVDLGVIPKYDINLNEVSKLPSNKSVSIISKNSKRKVSLNQPKGWNENHSAVTGKENTNYRIASASDPTPAPSKNLTALTGTNTYPPDVSGAVGNNFLFTALNNQIVIQNVQGYQVISPVSTLSFWTTKGVQVSYISDPHVSYDPYSQRWIICSIADYLSATPALLIAVSANNNPTGQWYAYKIAISQYKNNNPKVALDYPALGFNKNWIVITGNMFDQNSGNINGDVQMYIFNKNAIYSGGSANPILYNISQAGSTFIPAVTYDNSVNDLYCLATLYSGSLGQLKISGTAASPALSQGIQYFTASSNGWGENVVGQIAPQAGTTLKIDANDTRIMNVVYRNGYLWSTHNVFLPATNPTRASSQWYQLALNNATPIQTGLIDDPSGANFYCFPSIAVNANNDVAIGFTRFSGTTYPSAGYVYRSASNPAGTTQIPYIYKAGLNYYTDGNENRWGDFSSTVVDPSSDISFWTLQEYAESNSSHNYWGTQWARVGAGFTINNPIDLGIVNSYRFVGESTTINNTVGYGDAYTTSNLHGQSSPDVYFKLQLNVSTNLSIYTCPSYFDTYLHLLNSSGTEIYYNDDATQFCTTYYGGYGYNQYTSHIITPDLPIGTYYIVAEGFGNYTGNLTLLLTDNNGDSRLSDETNSNSESEYFLIPNPTIEAFRVSGNSKNIDKVQIYDLKGKLLKEVLQPDQINISEIPSGLYIVQIYDGVTITRKKLDIIR